MQGHMDDPLGQRVGMSVAVSAALGVLLNAGNPVLGEAGSPEANGLSATPEIASDLFIEPS